MDDGKGLQPDAVQRSPDTGKRKAEDPPSRGSPKQAKKDAALIQLKGSRLSLKQKAVAWDRTMPVLRGASYRANKQLYFLFSRFCHSVPRSRYRRCLRST